MPREAVRIPPPLSKVEASLNITRLTTNDIAAICRVQAKAYPSGFCESATVLVAKLPEAASDPSVLNVRSTPVARGLKTPEGDLVAYMLAHPWHRDSPPPLHADGFTLPLSPDVLHLHDLAIDPDRQGRGLATVLCSHLFETAAGSGWPTMTLVAVRGSADFWRRHGFQTIHEITYGNESALWMERRFMDVR